MFWGVVMAVLVSCFLLLGTCSCLEILRWCEVELLRWEMFGRPDQNAFLVLPAFSIPRLPWLALLFIHAGSR